MLLGSSPPKILILTCRCCWILLPGGRARLHTGPGLAGVSRCRGASGVHWFWFGRCGGRKSNDRRVPSVKRTQELIPTLEMIFNAVKAAGIRAIVSAGWGGLGGAEVPPNIFILPGHPGVPHDWLFTKVSAVCHRKSCLCPATAYASLLNVPDGGAGTTAIGLLLGKPTIIVPFFGDQPFWGNMVYKAGAGPEPIPQKKLNVERLANAIDFCKTPAAKAAAERMGAQIMAEVGPQRLNA